MSTSLIINDRPDRVERGYIHVYEKPVNVIAATFQINEDYAYRVSFDPITAKFTIQDLDSNNYVEVRMVRE